MFRKLIPVILIPMLALSACDLHVSLPVVITPGANVTDEINVPLPSDAAQVTHLTLSFGAGTLNLSPGASTLVSGTATYNVTDFKPTVTATGSNVRIDQGDYHFTGITDWSRIKNEWDLSLGSAPMDLTIKAGAYRAEYEFGGLSLTDLTIEDGAAEVKIAFSSPNPVEMSTLRYSTGASNVSLTGLANANFSMLDLKCGAGNYTLDFSGELRRDASVTIDTGMSNMTMVIPDGLPVQITVDGGLSNVTYGSGWTHTGSKYVHTGSGPQLTIMIDMGAGNLTLTH
jgi:hypothetical protein